jgi:hypothetical protein
MSDRGERVPQIGAIEFLCEVDEVRSVPGVKTPDIESVHRDLATANVYRQEFIKSLILICGGLFAFSVAFRPELRAVAKEALFWVAWTALGASMLGGFVQLAAWERFYSSFQRYEWKGRSGKPYRRRITLLRRAALLLQVLGFVMGVVALGSFTALNLSNVEKPAKTSSIGASGRPSATRTATLGTQSRPTPLG